MSLFSEHLGVIHWPCLEFACFVIEGEIYVLEFVPYLKKNFFFTVDEMCSLKYAGSSVKQVKFTKQKSSFHSNMDES